jgi:uncharacterized membrane protein
MTPFNFMLQLDEDRIVEAIRRAELLTSGEIRVYVSDAEVDDPVAAAEEHFVAMGMTATRERNGVLIYVAPRSRNFAVVGDEGVHARCGQSFWADVSAAMAREFRDERMTDGIVLGVGRCGQLLAEHFPRQADDVNELPDAILRGS